LEIGRKLPKRVSCDGNHPKKNRKISQKRKQARGYGENKTYTLSGRLRGKNSEKRVMNGTRSVGANGRARMGEGGGPKKENLV